MAKEKILLVDDEETVREVLAKLLAHYGYVASTAASAEEALEIMKTSQFDVVICDIVLPGMDGILFTEFLVRNYDADVIVITGYSSDYSYEDVVLKGASDILFKPIQGNELNLRIMRVLKERRIDRERIKLMDQLKNLSITDELTRLFNSRHFYRQMELEVDRSRRYDHPLSLLLLDIDKFKDYNDTFGHLAGDKTLHFVAQNIMQGLRKMDSAYRFGGEEFTVILPETVGSNAEKVAERIRAAIQGKALPIKADRPVHVTVSIGNTQYRPGEKPSTLIQRSDKAMYLAKQNGRNRVISVYDADSSSG
ncbi:MAG: diguanylate cyclase [Desulfobacterales bacterium]|nr:diguanylate cyclase [Desulfobacterales bacterium]